MDTVLKFSRGRVPLLISMPHAGLRLTPTVEAGLVDEALSLPDTDWHIPQLYDFAAELGASTLAAEYSRFVIDLNRPSDDKPLYAGATTGLFPSILFDGVPLFKDGQAPSAEERASYLEQIWTPYHQTLEQELARLRDEFGYALLFDAHSIRGHITRHYGDPANNIHAVQLELVQATYMDEFVPFHYRPDLADPTRVVLRELVEGMIDWGKAKYGR